MDFPPSAYFSPVYFQILRQECDRESAGTPRMIAIMSAAERLEQSLREAARKAQLDAERAPQQAGSNTEKEERQLREQR